MRLHMTRRLHGVVILSTAGVDATTWGQPGACIVN